MNCKTLWRILNHFSLCCLPLYYINVYLSRFLLSVFYEILYVGKDVSSFTCISLCCLPLYHINVYRSRFLLSVFYQILYVGKDFSSSLFCRSRFPHLISPQILGENISLRKNLCIKLSPSLLEVFVFSVLKEVEKWAKPLPSSFL